MKKKHLKRKILLCSIVLCLLCSCSNSQNENKTTGKEQQETSLQSKTVSDAELVTSLQQKYGENKESAMYDYEPSITVEKNEPVKVKLGFDITHTGWEYAIDKKDEPFYALYEDADLQYQMQLYTEYDKQNGEVQMMPSIADMRLFCCSHLPDAASRDNGEWGNYGKYYLVRYRDLNTGEKLEKPVITIVQVKGEIEETPKIQFFIDERGLGGFKWNPVEGADKYMVFSVKKEETTDSRNGGYLTLSEVAMTDQTSWTEDDMMDFTDFLSGREEIIRMNSKFCLYQTSEDGGNEIRKNPLKENIYYGVMALSADEKKNSMASNLYALDEIAPLLVESNAYHTEDEKLKPASVGEMPTHSWVVMCDGRLEQKLIEYDFDSVEVKNETVLMQDTKAGTEEVKQVSYFLIDYTIKGTALKNTMSVSKFQNETLEQDLKEIEERQKQLENKTGDISTDITIGEQQDSSEQAENENTVTEMKYTANSAFSEYLAIQLSNHKEQIDISSWEEHYDTDKITDAFFEAEYQNPLILGIESIHISKDGGQISVTYEDDKETYAKKQQEITAKLLEVTASIIKDGMSELEKEFAINQYLCDTITYDQEALENAKANNMKRTDAQYQDSFTAYGALLNGKCVCAGYAGAFRLLAEKAGLESIVVTGNLDGTLAHAWNKVKIDGKWQVLDVTNNDMQFYPNALLNLSNKAAESTLVENKKYALDSALEQYRADSTEQEYYYVNGKYFDLEKIADSLVTALQTEDKVNLRTEYSITDEQFEALMQTIQERMQGVTLGAGYWLGVIRVEKK